MFIPGDFDGVLAGTIISLSSAVSNIHSNINYEISLATLHLRQIQLKGQQSSLEIYDGAQKFLISF